MQVVDCCQMLMAASNAVVCHMGLKMWIGAEVLRVIEDIAWNDPNRRLKWILIGRRAIVFFCWLAQAQNVADFAILQY